MRCFHADYHPLQVSSQGEYNTPAKEASSPCGLRAVAASQTQRSNTTSRTSGLQRRRRTATTPAETKMNNKLKSESDQNSRKIFVRRKPLKELPSLTQCSRLFFARGNNTVIKRQSTLPAPIFIHLRHPAGGQFTRPSARPDDWLARQLSPPPHTIRSMSVTH